jgi:hypothetical protein
MRGPGFLIHGPAPSSVHGFDPQISSTPSRCHQCAEYSSRISDLEVHLTSAKCQAQTVFDKASKASSLTKQVSILDDKVSSLTAKILHHEECNSFLLGIVESACEMLRTILESKNCFLLYESYSPDHSGTSRDVLDLIRDFELKLINQLSILS